MEATKDGLDKVNQVLKNLLSASDAYHYIAVTEADSNEAFRAMKDAACKLALEVMKTGFVPMVLVAAEANGQMIAKVG